MFVPRLIEDEDDDEPGGHQPASVEGRFRTRLLQSSVESVKSAVYLLSSVFWLKAFYARESSQFD